MVSINKSVDIGAPVDRIWDIVSDVDKDPEYWTGMSLIKNTVRSGNFVERDAKVGFMGHEGHQVIKLIPKESVDLSMTSGPLKGSRTVKLNPLQYDRTRVEIAWDFEFSGVPVFARGFVKSQIERATSEALAKISQTAGNLRTSTKDAALVSTSDRRKKA